MAEPLDTEHFLAGYLAEADEHLRSANANLLAVEKALRAGQPHGKLVRELFRSLHTLKGLSAMVRVEPVVELAHHMEAILRDADRSRTRLSLASIELLLKGVAAIEQRVRAVAEKQPVPPAPEGLVAALSAPPPREASPKGAARLDLDPVLRAKLTPVELDQLVESTASGLRAFRVDFVPTPERAQRGVTITSVRERLQKLAEIVKVVPHGGATPGRLVFSIVLVTGAKESDLAEAAEAEGGVVPIAVARDESPTEEGEETPPPEGEVRREYVRVDVDRLDDALDKLSDLIVTRFKLSRAVTSLRDRGADVRELQGVLAETTRQLRDLRGSIMRARMVSVAELLERVPLIVRGLSQSTGKPVRVEIDAGKAELDKGVAERIFPALVHLVRNGVDHALESREARSRAGKPEEGTIRVTCHRHSDSQLELEVQDDGRGVDAAAVARRAGVPTPTSEAELLDLIVRPGLSTRESPTTTSGRGMGLDIVKRVVDGLGGELRLKTSPGTGSSFTLRVPLSISILDAFAIECSGQAFVVPVALVEEIVELEGPKLVRGPAPDTTTGVRLLQRRGRVTPLLELAGLLQLARSETLSKKALVCCRNGEPQAFEVDRMLGQQEVVIRPLEDPLVKVPGITGTTDLGDGRATLVLDLSALAGQASQRRRGVVA
jgi:two-component system chemotaxis sensor kinase CheA